MQDSYVNLFLNSVYAQAEPRAFLSILILFIARMLPIIAQSPFLGARILPNPVKVFLAFTLFAVFLPHFLLSISTPVNYDMRLLMLVCKEVFVGFIIGFLISIPFIIVQTTGMIIDNQRGAASLMVNDPTIQNQSSPIGIFFNWIMIYIFFVINGPFLFFDAVLKSYELIPPDQFINPNFFNTHSPFWQLSVRLFNDAMVLAIQLAAPALIAILMTDVFLGIANRLAQQLQITFLGLPLKSLLGLTVIWVGWNVLTTQFAKQCYVWINVVLDFLNMFAETQKAQG